MEASSGSSQKRSLSHSSDTSGYHSETLKVCARVSEGIPTPARPRRACGSPSPGRTGSRPGYPAGTLGTPAPCAALTLGEVHRPGPGRPASLRIGFVYSTHTPKWLSSPQNPFASCPDLNRKFYFPMFSGRATFAIWSATSLPF